MGNRKNIFISYRRADSQDFSGRLYDALSDEFEVFFDTEGGVKYAEVFPSALEEGIKKSDVVLMIIGSEFCQEFKAKEDEIDFVLEEILLAHRLGKVIMPILMRDVEFPKALPEALKFVEHLNAYPFGRGEFLMYVQNLSSKINEIINPNAFSKEVVEALERERLVVLFSQDFSDIQQEFNEIKRKISSRFSTNCFMVSVPSFVDDESEYFNAISTECGFDGVVKKANDWNRAMRQRLKKSHKPLLLFITDLEDGDEELDRKLATILRNLQRDFSHFHALLIGRKALARLVHEEGDLSPLNTAKEIFFPENGQILEEEKIIQLLQRFKKHKEQLCSYLKREHLGRFSTWSHNELLNQLFWRNLLVNKNGYYVWREERSKSIAKEILACP